MTPSSLSADTISMKHFTGFFGTEAMALFILILKNSFLIGLSKGQYSVSSLDEHRCVLLLSVASEAFFPS
jgi:hypothetical protein